MPKKLFKNEIEVRLQEKHSHRYRYDLSNYVNTRSMIDIICQEHGLFQQRVSDHLYSGCGCPQCDVTKKFTTIDFVNKSMEMHGAAYDYSKSVYGKNNYDKVIIICPTHGEFKQTPWAHMRGQGCPDCANNRLYTTLDFINMCNQKHNSFYDYGLTEYTGKNRYVTIICPRHGEFKQLAKLHLSGYGCKKCRMSKLESWLKLFLDERKIVWEYGKKFETLKHKRSLSFDFWLPEYNILIECDGIQHREAIDFFGGKKRLDEQIEKDRKKEDWCKENNIYLIRLKDFINPFELLKSDVIDLYSKIIPIEKRNLQKSDRIKNTSFDLDNRPRQEFYDFLSQLSKIDTNFVLDGEIFIKVDKTDLLIKLIDFFNYSEINADKKKLVNIYNIANKHGFKVVQIFEDDWIYKKEIIKSRLLNLLGKSHKIWARKTEVKFINDHKLMKDFMDATHIQGYVPSKYKIGIFHEEEMVGLLTLSDLRINLGQKKEEGTFEILRYSCKRGVNIIGGFDKALKLFIKTHNPKKIISYANKMWSNEINVYSRIGMKLESVSESSYFYIVGDRREGRFSYRKDVLLKKFGYSSEMTEHTIMLSNSVYRIFDAGCFKYVMVF